MTDTFRALVVEAGPDGKFTRRIGPRQLSELPAGDVLVRVRYSALNYKDCLSASGHRGVTRQYPHTPGIDAGGVVADSRAPGLKTGREVVVTGHDLGMNTSGGLAEFVRVPADWVLPLPPGLTLRDAIALGTAGLTAAQALAALQDGGVTPDSGPVLVTGATGGVGSLAVALLAQAGYAVTAATGKGDEHGWLRELGAMDVVERDSVRGPSERPLLSGAWSGAVDTLGGIYLDSVLRATRRGGVVVACGLVASPRLETNVYPFILRGIRLQGVETAELPLNRRRALWKKLAGAWRPRVLDKLVREISLEETDAWIARMLAGHTMGRVLVRVSESDAGGRTANRT